MDSALLCLEIASVASGYKVLNVATSNNRVRVLEGSPVGARFLVLLEGEESELSSVLKTVQDLCRAEADGLLIDHALVNRSQAEIGDALFSLAQKEMQSSLIVIEASTVSGCLDLAQQVVDKHRLTPIEIKVQRSSSGGAYGFFTGETESCARAASELHQARSFGFRATRVEHISQPTEAFLSFFQLSGNA